MNKRSSKRFASLALAAALVLGAGIAGALTLPDQASDVAKQRIEELQPPVGSDKQDDDGTATEPATHGDDVSAAARDDSTRGCEHGRAVSAVASAKAADNRQNDGAHPGPCGPNGANRGNHGQGSNGNHGQGNNGNHHGQGKPKNESGANNGNHGQGNNGSNASISDTKSSNVDGNGKSGQVHGKEVAPGQSGKSQADSLTDAIPSGV